MSGRGRARGGLARVVAACAAVFWGFFFFGLIDFLTPFTLGDFADHYLLETGWGLLYLVLVTVPLLVLVVRPGAAVALLELLCAGVALVIGALLATSPPHLLPGLGVLLTAACLAALRPPAPSLASARPGRLSTVVFAVGVLPAAAYAWEMARATENPEDTWGLDHYPAQAAFAIAVVLVALLAAYAVGRPGPGRWLAAGTAAYSAVWFGALSLTWPERVGSLGTGWGVVAITWGVALVVATAVDGRRMPVTSPARATPAGPSG